jgi:SAM-dependent methyltransferase
MASSRSKNIDPLTVEGFGQEWAAFDQTALSPAERDRMAEDYFSVFPFDRLTAQAEGFDLGCGSGRWAEWFLPRVGTLHCIDPSGAALEVARRRLSHDARAQFHECGVDEIPLSEASQDFGYSLGVLHHIPDTAAGLKQCVRFLKPGAPFLLYLYYRFENRPAWFRAVWRASDAVRNVICRLPFPLRKTVTTGLAAGIYWPLARSAAVAEKLGARVSNIPLSHYRDKSFYTMRTDALDRFGTRLEHRFTRPEIMTLMSDAGLVDIRFRESEPFWVACGLRAAPGSAG